MKARYQYGCLTRRKRKKAPDVWQFRWIENGKPDSMLIGTVDKYPTKADAERAVEYLRIKINARHEERQFHLTTLNAAIDLFLAEEVPSKAFSTGQTYRMYINRYIRPTWGGMLLGEIRPLPVEHWLRSLTKLSERTKQSIRNIFHVVFEFARRRELANGNPIDLVRQGGKRRGIPRVLAPEEFRALLGELSEPYKTMVLVCGGLGLRASEVFGLKWGDIDWEKLTVNVCRGVVAGRETSLKTEASQKPLPLDPDIATALLDLRRSSRYASQNDYIFANSTGGPRWQGMVLKDHIQPRAITAKIGKLGWHTLRHTFSSLLHAHGTTLAVQKELLRHANIQTTMNVYTQAVSEDKRAAASAVLGTLMNRKGSNA